MAAAIYSRVRCSDADLDDYLAKLNEYVDKSGLNICNILDQSGNIQSYVARDSVGEEAYKDFKKLDIGDIVGIEGEVFKTKTGEISIHASAVKLCPRVFRSCRKISRTDQY